MLFYPCYFFSTIPCTILCVNKNFGLNCLSLYLMATLLSKPFSFLPIDREARHFKMNSKEKNKLTQEEAQKQLKIVMDWVREQIEKQDVPRFSDVIEYAKGEMKFHHLSNKQITQALRLVPNYVMTSFQKRQKLRSDRNRPMIVNSIGQLHSDIGFYTLSNEYMTPVTKRSGFLIAKDSFTKFIFISILKKNRKANAMIQAFKNIFVQFKSQYPGERVKSIAFDRERSVTSGQVQQFFKEKKVLFHAFYNTSSKSKMAESAIKLVRTTVARLKGKEKKWWMLIDAAVKSLNSKPIRIRNKYLKMKDGRYYAPKDVNVENASHFLKQLQKADSSYYFSQFDIDPRWVTFEFKVDDFVRPKLIVTSSQVLGTKRSEQTLEEEIFIVEKCLPYVSRRNTIEKAYVCIGLTSNRKETFGEDEIALTPAPANI